MRILGRGNDGVRGQSGFTLLEMLVVLVLASIMLSMVAVNFFPDEQRALRDEGERLAYLLEQASKTSRAGGQPLAWSSSGREHRFWKKNKQGEWRRVEQEALLQPRVLPEDMRVTLLTLAERPAQPSDMLALSPELGAPNFELRLSRDAQSIRLVGDGLGNVRVMP
ncbi:MAG: prepilin-type N-terminal cleavage/methylation domain-containing protein [Sideroxydans sp.]